MSEPVSIRQSTSTPPIVTLAIGFKPTVLLNRSVNWALLSALSGLFSPPTPEVCPCFS